MQGVQKRNPSRVTGDASFSRRLSPKLVFIIFLVATVLCIRPQVEYYFAPNANSTVTFHSSKAPSSVASISASHLEGALLCYKNNSRDTMYYSAQQMSCLPFPGIGSADGATKYIHPADATLTSVMATVDDDLSGPTGSFRKDANNSYHNDKDTVIEKRSPSLHSRWFFDSWRLWEGENGLCEQPSTVQQPTRTGGEPLSENISFTTQGHHNTSLPVSLYDMYSFCVDELRGTLVGFEDNNSKIALDQFDGFTEHIYMAKFVTMERFLHPVNLEVIQLVGAGNSEWKSVITTSIEAHHRTLSATSLPPEVLFIEDLAMIIPITAFESQNPDHQFHRTGSNIAQARMLNVSSFIVLTDIVAEDPKMKWHQTKRHLAGTNAVPISDLLPPYLLTADDAGRPFFTSLISKMVDLFTPDTRVLASLSTTVSREDINNLNISRVVSRDWEHLAIVDVAASEARSTLWKKLPFEAEWGPLLSTGEEGCEGVRCGTAPNSVCSAVSVAERRRCGRPYAVVNVALPPKSGDGQNFNADTQNYSTVVWGLAVRETLREAKRMRRDIWLAKHSKTSSSNAPNTTESDGPFAYLSIWRRRAIAMAVSIAGAVNEDEDAIQLPIVQSIFEDYFTEFFASRLEANYYAERAPPPPPPPRRQLICYRRAVVGHVFHKTLLTSNLPATIGLSMTANCNLKDTFRSIYESAWARYGLCSKGDEPQKDPNRDAHPIFMLSKQVKKHLQTHFETSKKQIETILNTVSLKSNDELQSTLLSENIAVSRTHMSLLLSSIASIQKTYDETFIKFFTAGTKHGRPIKVFVAFRSSKRVLTHWRLHLSALINNGIGRFVEFEFAEGLAGGTFSPTDPHYSLRDPLATMRARQYHSYLTTDLFMGPHGADMHSVSFVKPSAFVTELASDGYDTTNTHAFRGGYFSAFAYSRNVGYLKVLISRKDTEPREMRETWEGSHQTYMSLSELRRTLSLSVCSWLATNTVRLRDEARAVNITWSQDTSYLLPWWCRGGPVAVVRKVLAQLENLKTDSLEKILEISISHPPGSSLVFTGLD